MATYTSSFRTTAGSSTLPIASIYAAAAESFTLRAVEVYNTTATDLAVRLIRLTTQGTAGTGQTEARWDPAIGAAAQATVFTTHSVAPSLGDELRRASIGAAVGAAVIWVFGRDGIKCPVGTANGIGILPVGTGQVCDVVFEWDE